MIFPGLKGKKFGYVNLNIEAQRWLAEHCKDVNKNPLIDPVTCQSMVQSVHEKLGLDFSYGGWLEDRSTLWKDSYLSDKNMMTHLGVDINVPAGTKVSVDFDAEIVRIENDYPLDGGWGTMIIMKHLSEPAYLLYAHLDPDISCKVSDVLKRGEVFAKVGSAPHNGNWFPHLHVQAIKPDHFQKVASTNDWEAFDGYGKAEDIPINAVNFPDPLQYISLI